MRICFIAALMILVGGCNQPKAPPSPELDYCEELFATFDRYLAPIERTRRRDLEADLAIDLCRSGRHAEGIPILEYKLQRARWPLPKYPTRQ